MVLGVVRQQESEGVSDAGAWGLTGEGLGCRRGRQWLFRGVSLAVSPGQALVVTGANGAGKTSLLRLLAGLRAPDAGRVLWQGQDVAHDGSGLGHELLWLGHEDAFKGQLTAYENLALLAAMRPSVQVSVSQALAQVGLATRAELAVSGFSAGMKRRLSLAGLLVCRGSLWVLDEPQTSLDAAGVALFEHLLAAHLACGGLAVMTTHHGVKLAPERVCSLVLGET